MRRYLGLLWVIALAWQMGCAAETKGPPTQSVPRTPSTEVSALVVPTPTSSPTTESPTAVQEHGILANLLGLKVSSPIRWAKPVWSPKGTMFGLATAKGIQMYDAQSLQTAWSVPPVAPAYTVSSVAFDHSGDRLFSFSRMGGLQVWDPISGTLLAEWPERRIAKSCWMWESYALLEVADGRESLVVMYEEDEQRNLDTRVDVWDNISGNCIRNLLVQDGNPASVDVSPDGRALAVGTITRAWVSPAGGLGGQEGVISVWDIASGRMTCSFPGVLGAFRPSNGLLLVQSTTDSTLTYWDIAKCEPISSLSWESPVFAMAFSPRGDLLALRSDALWIVVADTGQVLGKVNEVIPADIGEPIGYMEGGISFDPDGALLVSYAPTTAMDFSLVVWAINK